MTADKNVLIGKRFGRWVVTGEPVKTSRGEKKWLCTCDCGTTRYVLERSLIYGGSSSCGCLRKEQAFSAVSYDLTGKQFGDLTVIKRADVQRKNGGVWWLCSCSCGKSYETTASLLRAGRRTHCGCKTRRNPPIRDISGQRFGRLVALFPTDSRNKKGSVMWHCACDCGREVDISANNLLYSNQKSCGCLKKEHDFRLSSFLSHADRTSIDMLKSKKVPSNSSTGIKGVYRLGNSYVAKIVFQGRQFYLGRFDSIYDAAFARRCAEEELNRKVVAYYAAWKKRADADPVWAGENPVKIHVKKGVGVHLKVTFLPEL